MEASPLLKVSLHLEKGLRTARGANGPTDDEHERAGMQAKGRLGGNEERWLTRISLQVS